MKFIKFPNGKVWPMDGQNNITGVVSVPDLMNTDLEQFLGVVSNQATGADSGLVDFAYRLLGDDLVEFHGVAAGYIEAATEGTLAEEGYGELAIGDPALIHSLMALHALTSDEAQHALSTLGADYGPETKLEMAGSNRKICAPAYPEPCSYVRVLVGDLEVAYWNMDEVKHDPQDAIGALLGAAKGPTLQPILAAVGERVVTHADVCAKCKHCHRHGDKLSACWLNWPGLQDRDGYAGTVRACHAFVYAGTKTTD